MKPHTDSGWVEWQAPSNIAIVKYWGKRGRQLPQNASLSLSLSESQTRTRVEYSPRGAGEGLLQSFEFHGKSSSFAQRIEKYLESLISELPPLKEFSFKIQTQNSFPHSCGIASSASGFSALALCLSEIEQRHTKREICQDDFWQRASHLARLGSGSACRSLYGAFTLWGKGVEGVNSHDEYAIPLKEVHPDFLKLRDAICLVSSGVKPVSSGRGHQLMEDNPFAPERYQLANHRACKLISILHSGELEDFIQLAEAEALALHGLMMLSPGPFVLLRPNTLAIIERIHEFRGRHKLPVGFTIDAGPNIHLLYFESHRKQVENFIQEEIAPLTEGIIHDFLGEGPSRSFV